MFGCGGVVENVSGSSGVVVGSGGLYGCWRILGCSSGVYGVEMELWVGGRLW